MQRKFGVAVDVSLPRVPYRETIKSKVSHAEYKHKSKPADMGSMATWFSSIGGDLADDEGHPRVEERALRALRFAARSPPIAMYMKPGW